jgi:hypothetical protein
MYCDVSFLDYEKNEKNFHNQNLILKASIFCQEKTFKKNQNS